MRAKKKLKSGQNGTKSLLDKYGEQLLCARYRYDEARGLRHKTIDLIVETIPWSRQTGEIPSETIVGLKIGLQEVELQTAVRRARGKWNKKLQLLELRYDKAVMLDLASRIEPSTLPDSGKYSMPNSRNAGMPTIR